MAKRLLHTQLDVNTTSTTAGLPSNQSNHGCDENVAAGAKRLRLLFMLYVMIYYVSPSASNQASACSGVIQSPNYPEDYPSSQDCGYIITVESGSQVTLTFDEEFYVGKTSNYAGDCRYDRLQVK